MPRYRDRRLEVHANHLRRQPPTYESRNNEKTRETYRSIKLIHLKTVKYFVQGYEYAYMLYKE